MKNSFKTRTELSCSGKSYTIFDISKIDGVNELPYSIKILLENLVRNEDDLTVTKSDIEAIINWHDHAAKKEIMLIYLNSTQLPTLQSTNCKNSLSFKGSEKAPKKSYSFWFKP